ncbi:phasin family protein [Rhodobacter sp. NSM]|uniref:phasin family protein n=1 Tax=Rhodobacter sp. NSM TaxID=3457501 RepID=UPI003FD0E286
MTFSKTPPAIDATPATEGRRTASIAFEGGTANTYEFWLRLTNELNHFAADRICDTVKTQQQMMHCHSIAELAHLRAQWMQRAMDQYAEEAGRISEICRDAIDRAVRVRAT